MQRTYLRAMSRLNPSRNGSSHIFPRIIFYYEVFQNIFKGLADYSFNGFADNYRALIFQLLKSSRNQVNDFLAVTGTPRFNIEGAHYTGSSIPSIELESSEKDVWEIDDITIGKGNLIDKALAIGPITRSLRG